MRIIGIDPGSLTAGFAILEIDETQSSFSNRHIQHVSSGVIVLEKNGSMGDRLLQLSEDLSGLLQKYRPQEAAIENIFFAKNAKSALVLGQARGVCLMQFAHSKLQVFEYTPTQIKSAIGGSGRASKDQMEHMLRVMLKLPKNFQFVRHDHSDALAIALCHVHSRNSFYDRVSSRKDLISKPHAERD